MKNCDFCHKPMLVAKGKAVYDEDGKYLRTNPDQEARWHKECRAEGRRMERKKAKEDQCFY